MPSAGSAWATSPTTRSTPSATPTNTSMAMYASAAGKSGGEYYTPQEVSELLARITVVGKTAVNQVYDPACGSRSLLLKFAKVLGEDNVRQGFFGRESI